MSLRLILEVGSTKADWVFINQNGVKSQYKTTGYNPTYSTTPDTNFITVDVLEHLKSTEKIYYYGAGASSSKAKESIAKLFSEQGIKDIEIHTDLLAAARATCGINSGWVAILGTGSNSGFYNGKECNATFPSLGYLLGDHGSGSYIGKSLLQAYFFNEMPKLIAVLFAKEYGLTRETIINKLYTSESPAKVLGNYSMFLSQMDGEWKDNFLKNIFIEFVHLHFLNQPHIKISKLHFVGSIAYAFQDQLKEVCQERNIQTGEILKSPHTKLIEYHINNYD